MPALPAGLTCQQHSAFSSRKALAAAPSRAAPRCRPAAANVIAPRAVLSGSRPSPAPPSPPPPQRSASSGLRHAADRVVTPGSAVLAAVSSPASLALALGGGAILGAAAWHIGTDHASLATGVAAAAGAAKDFGPADLATAFGPTRPAWSVLINSGTHHATEIAQHTASSVTTVSTHVSTHVSSAVPHAAHLQPGSEHHVYLQQSQQLHDTTARHQSRVLTLEAARAAAADAADSAKQASGAVCGWYNRWLEESPLMCKIVTGNFFTIAGDMLAQLGTGGGGHGDTGAEGGGAAAAKGPKRVDWMRTLRLCVETSMLGTPIAHWWFGLLDGRIMPDNPHCPQAVLTKLFADQVVFAPVGLLMFFTAIKLLEGRPRDIPATLRTSYVKALMGGYLLWPLASLFNFALLPTEYRLLFNNCVNILWTCFLSIMSSESGAAAANPPADAQQQPGAAAAAAAAGSDGAAAADVAASGAVFAAAASGSSGTGSSDGSGPAGPHHQPPAPPQQHQHQHQQLAHAHASPLCLVQDLAVAAVTAAALSTSLSSQPSFATVTGLTVCVLETAFAARLAHAAAAGSTQQQQPSATEGAAAAPTPALVPLPVEAIVLSGAGGVVSGPGLLACSQVEDAVAEAR